jgi:hypothetical protein
LRSTAAFAGAKAEKMNVVVESMRAKLAQVGTTGDLLDACFARLDAVLSEIGRAKSGLEAEIRGGEDCYDPVEVADAFSSFYTTEMEREVMQAALLGTALPVTQQTFEGNSVELF